jgi:hypothetical protein
MGIRTMEENLSNHVAAVLFAVILVLAAVWVWGRMGIQLDITFML